MLQTSNRISLGEVKQHPFFAGIDVADVLQKTAAPPVLPQNQDSSQVVSTTSGRLIKVVFVGSFVGKTSLITTLINRGLSHF